MFTQFLWLSGVASGNAVGSVTLQQNGDLVAVQYNVFPLLTLGAGDEICAEIELSLNNVIAQSSQMSPPNGVVSKHICSAAADIAGTSMVYLNPAVGMISVPPRRVVAGQIFYVNIGTVSNRAGGAANYSGYLGLMIR